MQRTHQYQVQRVGQAKVEYPFTLALVVAAISKDEIHTMFLWLIIYYGE